MRLPRPSLLLWLLLAIFISLMDMHSASSIGKNHKTIQPNVAAGLPEAETVHRLNRRQGYALDLVTREVERLDALVGSMQHELFRFDHTMEELTHVPQVIVRQRSQRVAELREARTKLEFARKVQEAHKAVENFELWRNRASHHLQLVRERLDMDPRDRKTRAMVNVAESELETATRAWQRAKDKADQMVENPAFAPSVRLI